MKGRWPLRALALLSVVLTGVGPTTAAHAAASVPQGPQLISLNPPLVAAGHPHWVQAFWVTSSDLCDVQVTAAAPDVTVTYPTGTATYTSFYKGGALTAGKIDYTSFLVSAAPSTSEVVMLHVRISYVRASAATCQGTRRSWTAVVPFAVLAVPVAGS